MTFSEAQTTGWRMLWLERVTLSANRTSSNIDAQTWAAAQLTCSVTHPITTCGCRLIPTRCPDNVGVTPVWCWGDADVLHGSRKSVQALTSSQFLEQSNARAHLSPRCQKLLFVSRFDKRCSWTFQVSLLASQLSDDWRESVSLLKTREGKRTKSCFCCEQLNIQRRKCW